MKNLFAKISILITVVSLLSCSEKKPSEYYSKIQGDWTLYEKNNYLIFTDSIYNHESIMTEQIEKFKKYEIKNDTLTLFNAWNTNYFQYRIKNITNRTLWLNDIDESPEAPAKIAYKKVFYNTSHIFKLNKIEVLFDYDDTKMIFSLDSSKIGNVRYCFNDGKYPKFLGWPSDSGNYKIEFSESEFSLITDKILNIPFRELKEKTRGYGFKLYPKMKCIIDIENSGNNKHYRFRTSANGIGHYPRELDILYTYLHNLNTFHQLKRIENIYNYELECPYIRPRVVTCLN